ncbi:hypothetical protein AAVH_00515 [Aphelenchoides avenae]|nr:hypothetical protein AAVH_00515 [Aphelenchus avenae]
MDPAELAFIEGRLKQYAYAPYGDTLVSEETETMPYNLVSSGKTAVKRGTIHINTNTEQATEQAVLERFAFSHAIAASVKIGIWEAKMNDYAEPLSESAEVLSKGKIPWGRRQSITVNSLLNEDFYWDRQELEKYHVQMKRYFTVQRRVNELNSRIGYCEDLVKLIDSINSHRHASRLEWMIIFLIVVEVVFDAFHFLDSKPKPVYIVSPVTEEEG